MPAERRLAFGDVAEAYDEARPSYPSSLVDDVMTYARARPGDRAVEVGAGTGKATLAFAARGLRIVALEPSAEMARILRVKTGPGSAGGEVGPGSAGAKTGPGSVRVKTGPGSVRVAETEFERWRPEHAFRLVYSAQAWHWIEPETRYARAAKALAAGGALAVFWNRPRWETCTLREELLEAYQRTAPELGSDVGPGPMFPGVETVQAWWSDWSQELDQAAGFTDAEIRTYIWREPYATASYVRLISTHSDHIVLAETTRQALLDAVAEVIERHGGVLELEYATTLAMARHTGSRSEVAG